MDDLALSDHEEPAVPDVGGVEFEICVGQHHQARRAGPDDLLLVLLHFAETLNINNINSARNSGIE